MSAMRKFRNEVIRNNFGVHGLRKWRELNKERTRLTRAYRRLSAEAVEIAMSYGVQSNEYRAISAQIELLKAAIHGFAVRQLALVRPEIVQVMAEPEPKKPFFAGIVKGFKKLFGGGRS